MACGGHRGRVTLVAVVEAAGDGRAKAVGCQGRVGNGSWGREKVGDGSWGRVMAGNGGQ
jgi:hypothetical protein